MHIDMRTVTEIFYNYNYGITTYIPVHQISRMTNGITTANSR